MDNVMRAAIFLGYRSVAFQVYARAPGSGRYIKRLVCLAETALGLHATQAEASLRLAKGQNVPSLSLPQPAQLLTT